MKPSNSTDNNDTSISTNSEDSGSITHLDRADVHVIKIEKGGYEKSKELTRYGDWEISGRCIDF